MKVCLLMICNEILLASILVIMMECLRAYNEDVVFMGDRTLNNLSVFEIYFVEVHHNLFMIIFQIMYEYAQASMNSP